MVNRILPGAWTDRPAASDLPDAWKILRTGKNGTVPLYCLSPDTTGAYVHYWSGRTRLCLKSACEPCEKLNVPRWRGYLAVIVSTNRATRLLEVTPSCVLAIERQLTERGTLRGSVIQVSRKGKAANGELDLSFLPSGAYAGDLPADPDVRSHLCRIWRTTHVPLPSEIALDGRTECQSSGIIPASPSRNGKH